MAILPVLKFPHPALKTRAKEIDEITPEIKKLVRDMIDTMYAENGVGLAANQIGVLKRVFVANPDPDVKGNEMVFFNPKIIKREGVLKEFEGCLSVPELYEPVKRSRRVWMSATTLDGRQVEVKGEGLVSRIFQHEIDHLDGYLFVDRLGLLKSKLTQKKLHKRLKTRARS